MANHPRGEFFLQGEKEGLKKVFGAYIRTLESKKKELTNAFTFEETEDEIKILIPKGTRFVIDDKALGLIIDQLEFKKMDNIWQLTGRVMGKHTVDLLYFADMTYDFDLKGHAYAGDAMMDWKYVIEMDHKDILKNGKITPSTGEYDDFLIEPTAANAEQ